MPYKGFYIHGYCFKADTYVMFGNGAPLTNFKSLRAAQLGITKFLKKC
jgi:hypothetical protein